jgi:hypothetical protein
MHSWSFCLQNGFTYLDNSIIREWLEPPLIPWEPAAKAIGGETMSGNEQYGVLVLGDATELSHSMR